MPIATARRIKLKANKRAIEILARQAIGNDFLKGLIELITNSDESYARLERKGLVSNGEIQIEVGRRPRKNETRLRVIDWAEGMDDHQLERCVGNYGEDTSGQIGRGIFGMGLKDATIAFGEASITSFKNGRKYHCTLANVEDVEIKPYPGISSSDRREFRNTTGGTTVEIVVTNPKVKIPLMDSLRQQLQRHVCLRGIMTDAARKITLRDLHRGTADNLTYKVPEGETLLDEIELNLPSYPDIKPKLTVKQTSGPLPLSQQGSDRTGGIIIVSKRTCHEATLFGFDDDPHAAMLFGELRCDEIYDLQADGEPIVDKNRNGLKKDHQLTRELFDAARRHIETIVAHAKEKEKQKQEALEREKTRRRFKDAVRNLNQIANTELQIGGFGSGDGSQPIREPKIPQDGFEFMPDTYRIIVAERDSLKLRVQVDGSTGIAVSAKVDVSCDNPNIRILDDEPTIPDLLQDDPPLSVVRIGIEGLQANAQGFVTAKHGTKTAIAAVEVVSTKSQREHHPSGGLFKEIRYEARPELPRRSRFDRKDGHIWINTLGPSVDFYFGPRGEGQDSPAFQLLQAELVTEEACREIARVKRETKTLDTPPGIEELDAFYSYIDKLKAQYAPLIHKILVDSDIRRK